MQLFNGKDLTGWSGKFPDAWGVEDGILIGRGKQGSPDGWSELIHTRDDFQNVHLRVETRINAMGWASLRVRKQRGSYFGYKVWLSNDPDNTGAKTGRFDVDGGEDNFQVTNPPGGPQLRADEWFTLDFIARGSELVTEHQRQGSWHARPTPPLLAAKSSWRWPVRIRWSSSAGSKSRNYRRVRRTQMS